VEQFKIEYFEQEHGANTFPEFRTLTKEEMDHVLRLLKTRLGLPDKSDALEVLRTIDQKSFDVPGVDATEDVFDLHSVLARLGFSAERAFVNWNQFGSIDEFGVKDLCNSFDEIFYPPADDLEILDSKLTWLVSIRHYGAVRALALS
jgi:hypothetical protein